MSYLTEARLVARVGGKQQYDLLTDDDGGGETPDTNVTAQVLGDIDLLLDGYARRGGYTTPLDSTDASSIMAPLLDIANYKLRSRGNRVASEDDRQLYLDAMKILEAIGSGEWQFPSGPATGVVEEFGVDSEERLFTRTELEVM